MNKPIKYIIVRSRNKHYLSRRHSYCLLYSAIYYYCDLKQRISC